MIAFACRGAAVAAVLLLAAPGATPPAAADPAVSPDGAPAANNAAGRARGTVPAAPRRARPAGALVLAQALARALAGNPRLAVAAREIGAASGLRLQAGALPNPELSVELDNALGSRDYAGLKSAETTLQLSQLIELGGKRAARMAVGAAGESAAFWRLRATELDVMAETAAAFVAALAAQRRIAVYDSQIEALAPLLALLDRRATEGASSPADILRARAAVDMYRVERARAQAQWRVGLQELATLMGEGAPAFSRPAGRFDVVGRPPALRAALAAVEDNPQLARWTAEIARADGELAAARAKAVPDLRLSAGWRHYSDTRDNAVRLGLSAPLPVFDRNVGNIVAAQEGIGKGAAEFSGARLALIGAVGRAFANIEGARAELALLRGSVIPDARRAAELVQSGYEQGRFTLLETLDVRNGLLQALLREQEALLVFHTSVATIEGLTGRPFSLAGEAAR